MYKKEIIYFESPIFIRNAGNAAIRVNEKKINEILMNAFVFLKNT